MMLSEFMKIPLKEAVDRLSVAKVNAISDDVGNVIKVIVEYTPEEALKKGANKNGK